MNRDIAIPASGASVAVPLGPFKYLMIRAADVPFQISFDGGYWQTAKQNDRFDKSKENPTLEKIYVRAVNGLAAAVTILYEDNIISAQDTAQSIVLNFARGCGGAGQVITLNTAKAIGGANYSTTAGNRVDLAAGPLLFMPGVMNGKKRKTIYFDNRQGPNDCAIFDKDGNLFLWIKIGKDTPLFDTSADFYAGGVGNPATLFTFCELFYDQANS